MRNRASNNWSTIVGCMLLVAACSDGKPAQHDSRPADGRGVDAALRDITHPADLGGEARERGSMDLWIVGDAQPPIECAAPIDVWGVECFQYCNQDNDCVLTKVGCCSCSGGGKKVPIHKGWTAIFAKRFATCSYPPPGCPAVDYCGICAYGNTAAPLACTGGKCTIVCP